MDVTRVCSDLGDEAARHGLIRWLARNGHLDELRQRAASGDEYAQQWLKDLQWRGLQTWLGEGWRNARYSGVVRYPRVVAESGERATFARV
jgi:hypothetical protein